MPNSREYQIRITQQGAEALKASLGGIDSGFNNLSNSSKSYRGQLEKTNAVLRAQTTEHRSLLDKQTAVINARYDSEIAKAKKSLTNIKQIEKQKQDAFGKLKAGRDSGDISGSDFRKQVNAINDRYNFEMRKARDTFQTVKLLEKNKTLEVLKAQQAAKASQASVGALNKTALGFGAAAGIGIAARSMFQFGLNAKNTARDFESLRARLENMFLSVEAGTRAFDHFNQVAATTPFSLKQVVEAGATLKAFGLDAEKNIKIVTDLAAFMGRDLVESASAVGRAFAGGIGASEILRESGIINRITTRTGKSVNDFSRDLEGFRKAMFDTFTDPSQGIAGATDKLSKTIGGLESNSGDAFDRTLAKIGGTFAPGYKSLLRDLIGFTEAFENALKDSVERAKDFANLKVNVGAQTSSIDNLKARYLELSSQQDGSKEKQNELNAVIDDIKKVMPGAVSSVEGYGNALKVNLGVLDAFANAQKDLLKRTEADVFEGVKDDIRDTLRDLATFNARLEETQKTITNLSEGGDVSIEIKRQTAFGSDTPDLNIDNFIKQADALSGKSEESRAFLASLTRQLSNFYDLSDKANLEKIRKEIGLTDGQFAALEKEIASFQKSLADASKKGAADAAKVTGAAQVQQLESLKQRRALLELETQTFGSETAKQIAILSKRYEIDIEKAQANKAAVVELESLKQLEIDKINQQFAKRQAEQAKSLQFRRALLELETQDFDTETQKQIAILSERYRQEIDRAKDNKAAVIELEQIKTLEIERINQESQKRLESATIANRAKLRSQMKGFIKDLQGDFGELDISVFGLDKELPKPESFAPDKNHIEEWELYRGQLQDIGSLITDEFFDSIKEGENFFDGFAKAFGNMLEDMARQLIAKAAVFGLLNLVTGGAFGATTAGGLAGFVFNGGGGANLRQTPVFTPSEGNFNQAPKQVIVNNNISAIDAKSFEDRSRENGLAESMARTIGELL